MMVLTDWSEDTALGLLAFPGEDTVLVGALAADGDLLDLDVLKAGLVLVVLEVEGDGGAGDDFAGDPADTLELQDLVGRVAEVLVLRSGCNQHSLDDLSDALVRRYSRAQSDRRGRGWSWRRGRPL